MSFANLEGYQITGARFLIARPVALLADDMGIGKTSQAIRAADAVGLPVTVICPAILRRNWQREIIKFSWLHTGAKIIATGRDAVPDSGVVIVSYELAKTKPMRDRLRSRGPHVVILDEAHKLKTPRAARTKAVLAKNGIATTAKHVWFLTGTPTPNHPGELYNFMVAAGGYEGTYAQFVARYCETRDTVFGTKITGARNVPELIALRAPYYLRRTAADVGLNLPHLAEPDTITIDGDSATLAQINPGTLAAIDAASASGDWSLADTPSISTARRIIGTAKSKSVAALAECELEHVQKLIIFAMHRDLIAHLVEALKHYGAGALDGATAKKHREYLEDDFQNPAGKTRVLICQLQSASAGLNLTAASRILFAEWSWTPNDNDQAIARAQRRGQTQNVRVSYVSIAGSVDEDVARTGNRKRQTLRPLY